jgi:hypothetical protein
MFIGGDEKLCVHITFDAVGEALVQAHILGVGRHLTGNIFEDGLTYLCLQLLFLSF